MSELYQKPIPFQMGLQVPCRFRAQATAQSNFREDAQHLGPISHALARQKECQMGAALLRLRLRHNLSIR